MFKLGDKLRDRVSGFEGIATCRCEYLNGCVQWGLEAKRKEDGTKIEGAMIDEQQLVKVDDGLNSDDEEEATSETPKGGPSQSYSSEKAY